MTSRRAFTLIELLVVIAIIALLVSILMPSLSKAKDLARMAACMTNMKNLGGAMHQYMGENQGYYTPVLYGNTNNELNRYAQEASGLNDAQFAADQAKFGGAGSRGFAVMLWPYYKNMEMFICPGDRWAKTTTLDRPSGPIPQYWAGGEAFVGAPRQSFFANASVFRNNWSLPAKWTARQTAEMTKNPFTAVTPEFIQGVHGAAPAELVWIMDQGDGRGAYGGLPYERWTAFWGCTYGAIGGGRLRNPVPENQGASDIDGDYPTFCSAVWETHPRAEPNIWGWDSPGGGSDYLFMDGHVTNQKRFPTLREMGCAPN